MPAEDAPADEEIDGEDNDNPPEGEAAPVVPTHEPFSVKIVGMVQATRAQNGLRHNDHLRYRQYCSRRLRRLYNALRFKHGRGRFKNVPFPKDFQDARYIEILLIQAERAWGYGVQLKADNATAAQANTRWRHHSIARLAKAVKWAKFLESVCKIHTDQRTQLEAEAYSAFIEGAWLVEREDWSDALAKLTRCRKVCEHLGLASEQADAAVFRALSQELAPAVRECRYNLGMAYDGDGSDDDKSRPSKPSANASRKDLSEWNYRGHGLAIPSDKIKAKLMKCLQMVGEIKVGDAAAGGEVNEAYGELSAEFQDVLRDIHSDMISAGAGGETAEWRMLEAFARELAISMNIERNLVLLRNHLEKLDNMQEVVTAEARRNYRPDEGMRFCDLLKEDVNSLRELPETTDAISGMFDAYAEIVKNCRCLFLALCNVQVAKSLEAAALMDLLHGRLPDVKTARGAPNATGPLARLQPLFDGMQQGMAPRVGRWRCRILTQICTEAATQNEKDPEASAGIGGLDFASLAAFPPRCRDIPCKPLLFDLAFQCIEAPDIDSLLPKSSGAGGGDGDKGPSIIGRVAGAAGGLGRRLGGLGSLWGGKK
jgi:signal recognition particle subunit SRP68